MSLNLLIKLDFIDTNSEFSMVDYLDYPSNGQRRAPKNKKERSIHYISYGWFILFVVVYCLPKDAYYMRDSASIIGNVLRVRLCVRF